VANAGQLGLSDRDGVLGLYSTKLVSICVHFYVTVQLLDVTFLQILGGRNSAVCGVGRVANVDELEILHNEARLAG
jgi:hypothetical protein